MASQNDRQIQSISPATGSGFAGCSGFVPSLGSGAGFPTPMHPNYLLLHKTRLGEEHLPAGPFFCLGTAGPPAMSFSLSGKKGWFPWQNTFSLPAA